MSKKAGNYKNLDAIPTWKIQEILNSPNCTGIDGADYEPVRHELQDILWSRENSVRSWRRIDREIRQSAERRAVAPKVERVAPKVERVAPAKAPKLPPLPTETTLIRVVEYCGDAVESFKEFWREKSPNGFSYQETEIPPVILAF